MKKINELSSIKMLSIVSYSLFILSITLAFVNIYYTVLIFISSTLLLAYILLQKNRYVKNCLHKDVVNYMKSKNIRYIDLDLKSTSISKITFKKNTISRNILKEEVYIFILKFKKLTINQENLMVFLQLSNSGFVIIGDNIAESFKDSYEDISTHKVSLHDLYEIYKAFNESSYDLLHSRPRFISKYVFEAFYNSAERICL